MHLLALIMLMIGLSSAGQKPDELARLGALHEQASAAQNAGQYREAERLHRAVLEGIKQLPAFPPSELARQLANLASVLTLQDRPDEALPLLQRAQSLLAQQPSSDPAQYATLHGNFGEAYASRKEWTQAEREFNESINGLTQAGVTDRLYLFEYDHGLGYVYWKTGRLAEARKRYEAALRVVRDISPPSHPVRQRWEREYQTIVSDLGK